MSRLIKHDEQHPCEIKVSGESKWICMCGLSKNKPLCDGSHKKTKDEENGKLYEYEGDTRIEVTD